MSSTSTPAATPPLITLPDFTVARTHTGSAVYKRATITDDWHLVTFDAGQASATITALQATGADVQVVHDATHLLVDGQFPDTVVSFVAPTAITALRAKAADLRAKAERQRRDAGLDGAPHDGGASQTIKIAEAYEDAVTIIEQHEGNAVTHVA